MTGFRDAQLFPLGGRAFAFEIVIPEIAKRLSGTIQEKPLLLNGPG
jgi:hypothetical protein